MVIVFSLDWRNISVLLSFQFEKEKWAGCPLLESKQQQKMMRFGVLYLVFSHQPIQWKEQLFTFSIYGLSNLSINFQYSRHKYIRRGTQTRKDKPHWIQSALEKISVHGLIWYQRSNSKIIRSCIVIFALFVLFGLPIWTIFEFIKFYQTIQIKTVTEASRGNVFRYPNLTVCHSRYFDNQLLKGLLFDFQLNVLLKSNLNYW